MMEINGENVRDGIGKPEHWTYAQPQGETLHQGDLLKRTKKLEAVLEEFHKYYHAKDDYTHFLVLSQSCDLALCKGDYITLCAVKPLSAFIETELRDNKLQSEFAQQASTDGHLVCEENKKERLLNILSKLLNNNDPHSFFLRNAPNFGLREDSCACLRLSSAILMNEHYNKCLEARCLSLTEEFRAKLGWLVGNIYSRVATQDWAKREAKQIVKVWADTMCEWFPKEKMIAAERALQKAGERDLTPERIREVISGVDPVEDSQQKALKLIKDAITSATAIPEAYRDDAANTVVTELSLDATFMNKLKR